MPRRLLSLAVALAAMAGALGMRAYIGHPVERIIETHTVERIEPAPGAHVRAPKARQGSVRDHVASDRRAPSRRQPDDDIADELNRAWLRQ